MTLSFYVDYHTVWGESIAICFDRQPEGNGFGNPLAMRMIPDSSLWHIELACSDLRAAAGTGYSYMVVGSDGSVLRREWQKHIIPAADAATARLDLFDAWSDIPVDTPYMSSLFTDCVYRRNQSDRDVPVLPMPGTITLEVEAPLVPSDCTLAVAGSVPALGNWDIAKAVRFSDADYPKWRVSIPLSGLSGAFEYKFLIVKKATGELVEWEPGSNRIINLPSGMGSYYAIIVSGLKVQASLPLWRGAGVAIPVFSLRSESDFGIGDFTDIKIMADWAASTGQRIIQLLPVNDTNMTGEWTDSYPYNSISSFALHPIYIRPTEAGKLQNPARRNYYEEKRCELQALKAVDYEAVFALKMAYMRELFIQDGPLMIQSNDFKAFIEENDSWLTPYAAFCVLRDRFSTPDMSKWGEYAQYRKDSVDALLASNQPDVQLVYFIQYHLDRQLRSARDYAHERGVALKGDIPIGISRTSVDAWLYPELFNLNSSAGAPPDDFAKNGQNWGFPTYNWEAMARDDFKWWKNRFSNMARYFDAYRIDHVLGFFRIWQIPYDQIHGLLGVFNPALPFTAEELKNSYDFILNPEVNCKPYIADWTVADFFGNRAEEVKERFLSPIGGGRYSLKPEFSTQKAIAEWGSKLSEKSSDKELVEPLQNLIDQVLFLPDTTRKDMWHPRISGQQTCSYRALNDYERNQYDKLYNDFYYLRNNDFWRVKAMDKLPTITETTNMLACAEDLGMIPACVPSVLDSLKILTLEIQRMPKDPGSQFGNPATYPYLSVCSTSTHDMPGLRGWWEANHTISQSFFNHILHQSGEAPLSAEPWICSMIVESHLQSPSMLCVIPLQDYLSTDEKLRRQNHKEEVINEPSNPRHYWRYRMHLTLEQLQGANEFNERLRTMVTSAGR